MKVLAVLILIVALVIIIVPQTTNCAAGEGDPAMRMGGTGSATPSSASMEGAMPGAGAAPAAKPKCFWSARAEIVVGVPLLAIGVLLFFARRKETVRALGVLATISGVLTILVPITIIGTCLSSQMVCNREMKPTLLIAGGITLALAIAALVLGETRREDGGSGGVAPA